MMTPPMSLGDLGYHHRDVGVISDDIIDDREDDTVIPTGGVIISGVRMVRVVDD